MLFHVNFLRLVKKIRQINNIVSLADFMLFPNLAKHKKVEKKLKMHLISKRTKFDKQTAISGVLRNVSTLIH